jgi:serine/threonine-protein kinase
MDGMPKIGDLFGERYFVRRVLGQGGMGIVFAVEDLKLAGRKLAMKVAKTSGVEGAYSSEGTTLMRLDHPNLPQITDYFPPSMAGGLEAVVMEYIDGYSLSEWMEASREAMAFGDMLRIAMALCSALRYLHEQSRPIIHRDLKPSNVMIDGEGTVKLIDFGISRRYKEGKKGDTVQLGTAGYAAPERLLGGQSDARSDIYGLGAVLYSLTGRGSQSSAHSKAKGVVREASRLPAGWPSSIAAVLDRMVEPDPALRFQSMREVEQALAPWLADSLGRERKAATGGWKKPPSDGKRRRVAVLGLSGGAGASFLAITVAVLMARRGLSVAAAEYAEGRPEWMELLPRSFQSDSAQYWRSWNGSAGRERSETNKRGLPPVKWRPADNRTGSSAFAEADELDRFFNECGNEIQLADLSGNWQSEEAELLIRRSDHVVVISDPNAYKWQPAGLERLRRLQANHDVKRQQWHWIANKQSKFDGDREWLSMLPEWPRAVVPLLPQEKLWSIIWNGKWPTDYPQLDQKLARSLQPLLDVIDDKSKAGRG